VRDEVNAIQTAYLRTEMLPQPDRDESKQLFTSYVNAIVTAPETHGAPSAEELEAALPTRNVAPPPVDQSGIAGSKRSKVGFFLAGSFALVMSRICYVKVPLTPFEDLQRSLTAMEKASG
jgi:hypothetical protein